jgi:hypothetical protein
MVSDHCTVSLDETELVTLSVTADIADLGWLILLVLVDGKMAKWTDEIAPRLGVKHVVRPGIKYRVEIHRNWGIRVMSSGPVIRLFNWGR